MIAPLGKRIEQVTRNPIIAPISMACTTSHRESPVRAVFYKLLAEILTVL